MKIVMDTNILSALCLPKHDRCGNKWDRLRRFVNEGAIIYVPEIADYELRRGLEKIALDNPQSKHLSRLDQLIGKFEYLPIDTDIMRHAAKLWAQARNQGRPTASDAALDGDVILAAQALSVGAAVWTENVGHLGQFVKTAQ